MNKILMVVVVLELITTIILKVCNLYYRKRMKNIELIQDKDVKKQSLLNEEISYEKYKRISQKASIPNSPVRVNGDFTEFFISHISSDGKIIENNIMNIDCEENYE